MLSFDLFHDIPKIFVWFVLGLPTTVLAYVCSSSFSLQFVSTDSTLPVYHKAKDGGSDLRHPWMVIPSDDNRESAVQ